MAQAEGCRVHLFLGLAVARVFIKHHFHCLWMISPGISVVRTSYKIKFLKKFTIKTEAKIAKRTCNTKFFSEAGGPHRPFVQRGLALTWGELQSVPVRKGDRHYLWSAGQSLLHPLPLFQLAYWQSKECNYSHSACRGEA